MTGADLEAVARSIVAPGRGILAADESHGTIAKRFAGIGVESTESSRRRYRGMLLEADGAEEFIGGVILFDETIRQSGSDGTPFPQLLAAKGIVPGIKVDTGAKEMAGFPGEKITEGLDGLRDRLTEYRSLGAGFAKWRAVIAIGEGRPTGTCISANAEALARYAALCQECGLVPIVEPEVLMDGGHDLARCGDVTEETLHEVFSTLHRHRVLLEGMLLKPNMVLSGTECPVQASIQDVAHATVRAFRRTVPAAVPGIVFLSGGQSAVRATEHLNVMNSMGPQPWELSFSYGRALQQPALQAWAGRDENLGAAQRVYYHRAKCNSAARYGRYSADMEAEAA